MIYAHFYSDGHDLIERAFVGRGIEELDPQQTTAVAG